MWNDKEGELKKNAFLFSSVKRSLVVEKVWGREKKKKRKNSKYRDNFILNFLVNNFIHFYIPRILWEIWYNLKRITKPYFVTFFVFFLGKKFIIISCPLQILFPSRVKALQGTRKVSISPA